MNQPISNIVQVIQPIKTIVTKYLRHHETKLSGGFLYLEVAKLFCDLVLCTIHQSHSSICQPIKSISIDTKQTNTTPFSSHRASNRALKMTNTIINAAITSNDTIIP